MLNDTLYFVPSIRRKIAVKRLLKSGAISATQKCIIKSFDHLLVLSEKEDIGDLLLPKNHITRPSASQITRKWTALSPRGRDFPSCIYFRGQHRGKLSSVDTMITTLLLLRLVDLLPKTILLLLPSHEREVPRRLSMPLYTTSIHKLVLSQIIMTPIISV